MYNYLQFATEMNLQFYEYSTKMRFWYQHIIYEKNAMNYLDKSGLYNTQKPINTI